MNEEVKQAMERLRLAQIVAVVSALQRVVEAWARDGLASPSTTDMVMAAYDELELELPETIDADAEFAELCERLYDKQCDGADLIDQAVWLVNRLYGDPGEVSLLEVALVAAMRREGRR